MISTRGACSLRIDNVLIRSVARFTRRPLVQTARLVDRGGSSFARVLVTRIARSARCPMREYTTERVVARPVNEAEFLNTLALEASKNQLTYKNDMEAFREFTGKITNLTDKRNKIRDEKAGAGGDGDGGGKKAKGKGKK